MCGKMFSFSNTSRAHKASNSKRCMLIALVQIAFTATMLLFAGSKLHWDDEGGSGSSSISPGIRTLLLIVSPYWSAAIILCSAVCTGLLICRWRLLWKTLGPAPHWAAFAATWIRSQAIGLLPTSEMGSDAFRLLWGTTWYKPVKPLIGMILFERICGLAGLAFSVILGIVLLEVYRSPSDVSSHFTFSSVTKVWVPLLLALVAISFLIPLTRVSCLVRAGQRLMAKWGISSIPWSVFLQVLFLSIILHLSSAAIFALADRALGLSTPLWCFLVSVPILNLARFLPIHIAGIGLVEGGFYVLLHPWAGRTIEEITAMSLVNRGFGLAWIAGTNLLVLLVTMLRNSPKNFDLSKSERITTETA
jgi:uncharacterized membrane protein YbhN (UPF0104 family)